MKYIQLLLLSCLISTFAYASIFGIWNGANSTIEVGMVDNAPILKVTDLYTNFCGPFIKTEGMKRNDDLKLKAGEIPAILLTLSEDSKCIEDHMKNGVIQYGGQAIKEFNIDKIFHSNSILEEAFPKYLQGEIDVVIEFQKVEDLKQIRFTYSDTKKGKILYKSAYKDGKQIYPEVETH